LREYVTDRAAAEDNMAVQETQHALHGHTHVPAAWTATPARVAFIQPWSHGRARPRDLPDADQPRQRRPAARR
jgi:hypothetical protein